jgi:hypothetical protein
MIDFESALMAENTDAVGVVLASVRDKPHPYYLEYKL